MGKLTAQFAQENHIFIKPNCQTSTSKCIKLKVNPESQNSRGTKVQLTDCTPHVE